MKSLVESYDGKSNFWEVCPEFLLVETIRDYYKKDKSLKKKDSSDFCWKVILCYHPESDLYSLSTKEKEIFGKGYLDILDKNKEIISVLNDSFIPQSMKSLINWENALKQRDEFLAEQRYSFDYYDDESNKLMKGNSEQLDKMRINTSKLYDELDKIKIKIANELSMSANSNSGDLRNDKNF